MPKIDYIYVECPLCGMQYTINSSAMYIADEDENEENDVYPEFCSFCGNPVDIDGWMDIQ